MTEKIWTHSADSHFLEPKDLWRQLLPVALADRMPRVERISDDEERVHVDGKSFVRTLPKIMKAKGATGHTIAELSHRPPGSRDIRRASRRSRPRGRVGRGDVPVDRVVVRAHRRSPVDSRRRARRERVAGHRDPSHRTRSTRARSADASGRRRGRGRRTPPRRRSRLASDQYDDGTPKRRQGLQRRLVGTTVGRRRGQRTW